MHYKAVLFDFDYTLGDSTSAIYTGFATGFAAMGLPDPGLEAVRRTIGLTLEDAFLQLTGDDSPAKGAEFRAQFMQHARPLMREQSVLFPGCVELLCALAAAGITTGVVSTKHASSICEIFEKFELTAAVRLVVGGEHVTRPKPDPEGLNAALAQLALSPKDALFCGDTTIDAKTAQAAGTDFCAVLNGTTPAEAFADFPSVHIAKNLRALGAYLGLTLAES